MHPKDMAAIWERWSSGETLFAIATDYGVRAAKLHADLQEYWAGKERERAAQSRVGAA